jgi:hypothetical protein
METYYDLEFITTTDSLGIKCYKFFDNGYGISVVQSPFSYGGRDGLFEVAVLDSDGHIVYYTPVMEDVVGHLTPEGVTRYMGEIQKLGGLKEFKFFRK